MSAFKLSCLPCAILLLMLGAAQAQPVAPGASSGHPPQATHRIDRLPRPAAAARSEVDIEALARRYETAGVGAPTVAANARLLVFVSLAMPDGAMRRLMTDGERVGAVLLLRGLEGGSLRKTTERVRRLAGGQTGAIQIDPKAFLTYGVQHVPVFVLAKNDGETKPCGEARCAAPGGFVSVAGDVTMDYALRHVASSAPAFAAHARYLLQRLERSP